MVNSEKEPFNGRKIDDGQSIGEDASSSSAVPLGGSSLSLADVDGDVLLREENVLQWLLALDMQVMGACRADERLKPLLKLNISTGAAEDRLLAHLSQHFEPVEIGMLARCLCIPLVSVRAGKINKQGNLLCPTDKRGSLNLILLPTSDLRISFVGDNGHTERLATFSRDYVEIEGISADESGRSFLLRRRDCEVLYFWLSEKSKLLGAELLRKMKDLLKKKPSLAELSGISESRLDSFGSHLRSYLAGSSVTNAQTSPTPASLDSSLDSLGLNGVSTIASLDHVSDSHGLESSSLLCQDGMPRRNSSSLGIVAREKLGGESDLMTSSKCCEKDKQQHPEATGTCLFPPLSSLADDLFLLHPPTQVSSSSSPYYCLYPSATGTAAALPYTKSISISISHLPVSSAEPFILPSLSSLLSSARSSSLLSSTRPLAGADFPSLDFPPLMPEPLVRSQLAMPSSQQIPTFTPLPLICDSIVHLPVIDICSSGQVFLVSAGPTISTTIPPLHSNLVIPLTPEAESMVEKGARETLRWLISGSSNQPHSLLDVLPSLIINGDQKHNNILATGSRGMYIGTADVNTFTSGVAAAAMGGPVGDGVTNHRGFSSDDFVYLPEEPTGSGGSATVNDGPSNVREERTD